MLMPRPPYTTTCSNHNNRSNNNNIININSGMEITARPMEQQHQQHHINQLLTTAAAGTGVVGDVDALLTPLQQLAAAQLLEQRPERNLWRTDEIMQMLKLMQQTNAIEKLNDKTIKSENVFRTIEDMMHDIGYRKKSHVQIWTKWKFLKSTYTTSKRNGVVPKMIPYEIYEVLHKMLSGSSSDCGGNSTTGSLDGDNSNGRMVISGVEGGYSNGNKNGSGGGVDSEDESGGFGMAHPIFGFRLGMVKQEPVDTGYENNTNNGNGAPDKDPLDDLNASSPGSSTANVRFHTEIKQEIEDEPFVHRTLEQQQQLQQHQQSSEILLKKRPVRITAIPAATSTLNVSATVASPSSPTPSSLSAAVRNPQLPPLRIAPFAKAPSSANALLQQQATLNRPPPPLSMHPGTPRPVRMTSGSGNMQSGATGKFALPKIMSKPTAAAQAPMNMPVRLPKDITIQSRSAANANMPRLKQVPTRKTPYSLRPDRMIPDLSASRSPPPASAQVMPNKYATAVAQPMYHHQDPGPTTSQRAFNIPAIPSRLQSMMMDGNRKRRLEIPPMPTRAKMPSTMNAKQMPPQNYYNGGDAENDMGKDDEPDDDRSMFDCASAQRASFNASTQQQYPKAKTPLKPAPTAAAASAARKDQTFFESALKDLGTSLRQMQREMIGDFFEKQMELSKREHEFQMKQDLLIMQAFEEQTQKIMRTAKELLGVNLGKVTSESTMSIGAIKPSTSAAKQKIKPTLRKETSKTKVVNNIKESNKTPMMPIVQLVDPPQTVDSEAATATLDNEDEDVAEDENVDDPRAAEEDEGDADSDGDVNDNDDEEDDTNEQLQYEDGEYLQDNIVLAVQQFENGEDFEEEEDEEEDEEEEEDENNENELVNGKVIERTIEGSADDDEEEENEEQNDPDDDDNEGEDNVADPIQLVSSELIEGN